MTYEETRTFMRGLAKEFGLYVVQARAHTNFYIHSPYLTYQIDGSPGNVLNKYVLNKYGDLAVIMEPKEMTVYTDVYLNSEKTGIETGRGLTIPYPEADPARIRKTVASLIAKLESLSQQLETSRIRNSAADLEKLL